MERRPDACPRCGSHKVARIFWGLPAFTDELRAQVDRGEVVFGGCVVYGDEANWHCHDCLHQWASKRSDGSPVSDERNKLSD